MTNHPTGEWSKTLLRKGALEKGGPKHATSVEEEMTLLGCEERRPDEGAEAENLMKEKRERGES